MDKKYLLSTAYFPPVAYFSVINRSEEFFIEGMESFQKQTYRTRCYIDSGNGPFFLNIPVARIPENNRFIKDVRLDYSEDWVRQHTRSLISSYGSTPFFEYYFYDDILPVYEKKHKFLFDMNMEFLELVMNLAGIRKRYSVTVDYDKNPVGIVDLRKIISPKKDYSEIYEIKPYYQVFSHKHGFTPGLSILDLLFHEGPNTTSYL